MLVLDNDIEDLEIMINEEMNELKRECCKQFDINNNIKHITIEFDDVKTLIIKSKRGLYFKQSYNSYFVKRIFKKYIQILEHNDRLEHLEYLDEMLNN